MKTENSKLISRKSKKENFQAYKDNQDTSYEEIAPIFFVFSFQKDNKFYK